MGKPVNGLEKIYINFKHNIVKKEELWTLPVEDVDLHPDSHLKRNALFWHEGEVGRVLLLVGLRCGALGLLLGRLSAQDAPPRAVRRYVDLR